MKQLYKIVLTGAPASGKTEFFEKIKHSELFSEFVFFDELARTILLESPDIRSDQESFHLEIYKRQIARESLAKDSSFVTDRGTLDGISFYDGTLASVGSSIEQEYGRYSHIIHLESSAILGEQYYSQDKIRTESIEESLIIDKKLREIYSNHKNYILINAEYDFKLKYDKFYKTFLSFVSI